MSPFDPELPDDFGRYTDLDTAYDTIVQCADLLEDIEYAYTEINELASTFCDLYPEAEDYDHDFKGDLKDLRREAERLFKKAEELRDLIRTI